MHALVSQSGRGTPLRTARVWVRFPPRAPMFISCPSGPTAEATTSRVVKVRVRIPGRTPPHLLEDHALVEELANSPGSDPGGRKAVWVQVPPGAPTLEVVCFTPPRVHAALAEWHEALAFQASNAGSIPASCTNNSGNLECLRFEGSRGGIEAGESEKGKGKSGRSRTLSVGRCGCLLSPLTFLLSPLPFTLSRTSPMFSRFRRVEMAEDSSDRLQPGSRG
jgi:hypothetical protein